MKNCYLLSLIVFIFDILRITIFSERHSVFLAMVQNDVTTEIYSSEVIFNVTCELSNPMGRTEFSSMAKIEQSLSHR